MVTVQTIVQNEVGLHARPAAVFVQCANQFRSRITIRNTSNSSCLPVNAKSILKVLTLGVGKGDAVEITVEGEDEEQAAVTLKDLIDADFPSPMKPALGGIR